MKWFVMIHHPSCKRPVPLEDEDDNVDLFDSEQEAYKRAEENSLANAYGYEVYPWPAEK